MKQIFLVFTLLMLTACSGGLEFKASNEVQSYVRGIITEDVASVEVEIKWDFIYLYVENRGGLSIRERYFLPKPNVFSGRYNIEYHCEESCLVTYDERTAEALDDRLLEFLFDKHVKRAVDALGRKSKMMNKV